MTNSRRKGKVGELELCRFLTDEGFNARRGQQYKGSPDSPDIECESLRRLHIECKRRERLNLYEALEQASDEAGEAHPPVVFHRRNRHDWVVSLDARDFLDIVRESDVVDSSE